jgi:hypothetical protein
MAWSLNPGDLNHLTLLLLVAVFLIIICAFVSSVKVENKKQCIRGYVIENYEARAPITTEYHKARNYLYNLNGMVYFYCFGDPASNIVNKTVSIEDGTNVANKLVSFNFTHLDSYCESLNNIQDEYRCNNIFIDYYACNDVFMSAMSKYEKQSSSTSSLLSVDASACQVRVLNNYYKLLKRTLVFDNVVVQQNDGIQLFNTNSRLPGYQLTLTGNIAAFALSRPMFISFGPFGLFGIRQFIDASTDSSLNVFGNYTSEDPTASYNIYIYQMSYPEIYSSFRMQPSKYENITTLTQLFNATDNRHVAEKFPITIYYLNYYRPMVSILTSVDVNYLNTISLVLSKEFLHNFNNGLGSNQRSITINFQPFTNTGISTTNISFIQGMDFSYDLKSTNPEEVATLTLSSGPNTQEFKLHPKFLAKLAALRAPNSNVNHNYHIVLSISFDCVTIVSYLQTKGAENVSDLCYMTRNQTRLQSRDLVLSYKGSIFDTSASSTKEIVDEMKKYSSLLTTSTIPNYAYLAKALGYYI